MGAFYCEGDRLNAVTCVRMSYGRGNRRPASAIRSVCIRFIGVCIIVSCKTCQKPNGGHRRQHYGCVCVFISAVECCDVLTDTRDPDPDTIQSNAGRVGKPTVYCSKVLSRKSENICCFTIYTVSISITKNSNAP